MTEDSTGAGAPGGEPLPAADGETLPPAAADGEPLPAPAGETLPAALYPWMYQPVAEAEAPAAPGPKPRRWRRRLAVAMVGLLALGALGGGVAAAIDQHNEKVKRERLAALKRVEIAYVAAVKPLAVRLFDAVQPIQDSLDGFRDLKPGVSDARDDVVAHGGATGEIAAVRQAVASLKPAPTQVKKSQDLLRSIAELSAAVKKLRDVVPTLRKAGGWTEAYSSAADAFTSAEASWGLSLFNLQVNLSLPKPSARRDAALGRSVPTLGGFIIGSDLACGQGEADLYDIRHPKPANAIKALPAEAKVLRRTVAALRKVAVPASRAALHTRLDTELQSVLSLAASEDHMYAAFKKHDYAAFKKAFDLWDEQDQAFRRLDGTYKSLGVTVCTYFFGTDDKTTKKSLSA